MQLPSEISPLLCTPTSPRTTQLPPTNGRERSQMQAPVHFIRDGHGSGLGGLQKAHGCWPTECRVGWRGRMSHPQAQPDRQMSFGFQDLNHSSAQNTPVHPREADSQASYSLINISWVTLAMRTPCWSQVKKACRTSELRGVFLRPVSTAGTIKTHRAQRKARCYIGTDSPWNAKGLASRGWKFLHKF